MKGNRVLAAVSAAQLASGLGGMALGIRRRHAFDIPFWQGRQSAVGRDRVLMGTALSAPVVMLAAPGMGNSGPVPAAGYHSGTHAGRPGRRDAADNAILETDRADIMSALMVARECCRPDDVPQCRLFIRAVGALVRFLGFRNALNERITWAKSALEVAKVLGDNEAIAELCASAIAWPLLQLGNYSEAEYYCLEGIRAAQLCSDPRVAARWAGNAARSLSGIARDADDGPKARHWATEAADYGDRCEDETLIRGAKLDFGYAALLLGNFEEAEHLFSTLLEQEECGDDDERIGNRSSDVALALMNRALRSTVGSERARLCSEARGYLERSKRLSEKIKHVVLLGECEISLATWPGSRAKMASIGA